MLLLKPTPTLYASRSLLFYCAASPCQSQSRGCHRPLAPSTTSSPRSRCRTYASVHNGEPTEQQNSGPYAHQWPTAADPTPYEIFGQTKTAPYNKRRFHELVKIYHPDRHPHTIHDGIPHPTKLERYRLVVAANDILSNPHKRRQYDLYGVGWGMQPDLRSACRTADRNWRHRPGSPSMNATWEDWDRWHRERSGNGPRQEPLYVSNAAFAFFVGVFAIVGSWTHVSRADRHSINLLDMREREHAAVIKALNQRQSQAAGLSREDRVENFLKQRDPWVQVDAPHDRHHPHQHHHVTERTAVHPNEST